MSSDEFWRLPGILPLASAQRLYPNPSGMDIVCPAYPDIRILDIWRAIFRRTRHADARGFRLALVRVRSARSGMYVPLSFPPTYTSLFQIIRCFSALLSSPQKLIGSFVPLCPLYARPRPIWHLWLHPLHTRHRRCWALVPAETRHRHWTRVDRCRARRGDIPHHA